MTSPPHAPNRANAAEEAPAIVKDPILGIFNDALDLLDEVVEEAMRIREERPWRLPLGE